MQRIRDTVHPDRRATDPKAGNNNIANPQQQTNDDTPHPLYLYTCSNDGGGDDDDDLIHRKPRRIGEGTRDRAVLQRPMLSCIYRFLPGG